MSSEIRLLGALVRLTALHPQGFTTEQLCECARVDVGAARAFLDPATGTGYTDAIEDGKHLLHPDRRFDLIRRLTEIRRKIEGESAQSEPYDQLGFIELVLDRLESGDDSPDVWREKQESVQLELLWAEADLRALRAQGLPLADAFGERLQALKRRLDLLVV